MNRADSVKNQSLKFFFNQGLIEPDRFFNHDHDRDDFFSIKG
jgi:hypothetical protein